jgi:hypothetical protein
MTININDCFEYVGRKVFAGKTMTSVFGGNFLTSALITTGVMILLVVAWDDDTRSRVGVGVYVFIIVLFGVYAHGSVVRYSSIDRSKEERNHSLIERAVSANAKDSENYESKVIGASETSAPPPAAVFADESLKPVEDDLLFDIGTVENPYESLVQG